MASKKYELAREGAMTEDGRYIEVGSLTLPTEPIPLIDRGSIIGKITNVHREGSRIYGDVDWGLAYEPEAVTIDVAEAVIDIEDEKVLFKSGKVSSANVNSADSYPWKD